MSIATEVTKLLTLRNRLRTKLTGLGLTRSDAVLSDCVSAVEGINRQGSIQITVRPNEAYNIPAGLHDGTGVVIGTDGGTVPNYQNKTAIPTKERQAVVPDQGYDALSGVLVEPIPARFQDVSGVTAGAADVLATKLFVNASGQTVAGTMPNNGKVSTAIDGINTMSYTIPAGFHSGTGTVTLTGDIEAALAAI